MAPEPDMITVITNAAVFDGTGAPAIPGATVVVRGRRVEAVLGNAGTPGLGAAEVIDARGMTLVPGLIDMHTHLLWPEALRDFLVHGVTTVRDVGNDLECVARWAAEERAGELFSPRIFFCGPPLEGSPAMIESPIQMVLSSPDEATDMVGRLADAGVCAIKLYMGITEELMSAAVGAAHNRHLPVTAHLGRVSASRGAALGLDGVEHVAQGLYNDVVPPEARLGADDRRTLGLPRFWALFLAGWAGVDPGSEASRRIIELLVEGSLYLVPTLGTQVCKAFSAPQEQVDAGSMAATPDAVVSNWATMHAAMTRGWDESAHATAAAAVDRMQRFVGAFHAAGGRVVTGSDVGAAYMVPGVSLHRELELLVHSGLSERDALHSATGAAAAVLGQHELGTIETGKLADMLLVDGDPCARICDLRRIIAVFKGGEIVHGAAPRRAAREGDA